MAALAEIRERFIDRHSLVTQYADLSSYFGITFSPDHPTDGIPLTIRNSFTGVSTIGDGDMPHDQLAGFVPRFGAIVYVYEREYPAIQHAIIAEYVRQNRQSNIPEFSAMPRLLRSIEPLEGAKREKGVDAVSQSFAHYIFDSGLPYWIVDQLAAGYNKRYEPPIIEYRRLSQFMYDPEHQIARGSGRRDSREQVERCYEVIASQFRKFKQGSDLSGEIERFLSHYDHVRVEPVGYLFVQRAINLLGRDTKTIIPYLIAHPPESYEELVIPEKYVERVTVGNNAAQ